MEVEEKLTELPALLSDSFARLRDAAPFAHVVVVDYPRVFTVGGGRGADCGDLLISADEREWLNVVAIDLSVVIRSSAHDAGFGFVSMLGALSGHEICSDDPWIHDIFLNQFQRMWSFHPIGRGQLAMSETFQDNVGSVLDELDGQH